MACTGYAHITRGFATKEMTSSGLCHYDALVPLIYVLELRNCLVWFVCDVASSNNASTWCALIASTSIGTYTIHTRTGISMPIHGYV